MKQPKIGLVTVGHSIYFEQFEGLFEELSKKGEAFAALLGEENCEIYNAGYIDRPEDAFAAVRALKREDVDLLFILLSTYVPSAVCAPFAKYLAVPQVLVGSQPLEHLDYAHTTTFMQLCNDDVCAMPEATGVYRRLGKKIPPCIVASASQEEYIKREVNEWVDAANAMAAFKYSTIGYLGHTYEGMYDMHSDPTAFSREFGSHVKMIEMCELMRLSSDSGTNCSQKSDKVRRVFRTVIILH